MGILERASWKLREHSERKQKRRTEGLGKLMEHSNPFPFNSEHTVGNFAEHAMETM